jgi:hypothetical protein
MLPQMDMRSLFHSMYPGGLRVLYVDARSGVDTATGLSRAASLATIQAALDKALPGDRILVHDGIYGYAQAYNKRGGPDTWITVEAAPGHHPIIDVTTSVASYDATKLTDGFDIQVCSYFGLFGFEIRSSQTTKDVNPSGVAVFRGSSNIAVWANDIHDFPGGGVNCFYIKGDASYSPPLPAGGWDNVDVFFNTIHGTSKYSEFNTSGISFYGAEDLAGLLPGGYGYRAVGNYIYDVICTKAYTPGGFTDVTDGNGISPDSLAVPNNLNPNAPVYLKRGLIEGNLITGCGGRAVHIYNTKNLDVVNNTAVGNLRTNSPYINGSTEVDLQLDNGYADNGVRISGNVFLPMNTPNTVDKNAAVVTDNLLLGGTDAVGTNVDARAQGAAWFRGAITMAALLAGLGLPGLAPVAERRTTRLATTVGYQALAVGGRGVQGQYGAVEVPVAAKAFR